MRGEEFLKQKRMLMVYNAIMIVAQFIILCVYYFGEKQTLLAFPMCLLLFMTVHTFYTITRLGK